MKKNWLLIIMSGIIYLAIVIVSILFIVLPGVNKLKEASDIKELTYENQTKLIDEINQKYVLLEQEVYNKYAPTIEEINNKYSSLETQIKDKYVANEQEINNQISDKEVEKNQEFFQNQFSKRFYTLQDEISALRKQKREIASQEQQEIANNSALKQAEIRTLEENKAAELSRLSENKNQEIADINHQNTTKSAIKIEGIARIIIGCVVILIPILYVIIIFNKLTHLYNLVKEKWSQVDVLLKQRTDLIPNIVESVKGFSNHEKSTLTKVTQARNQAVSATTKEEEIVANQNLSNVIGKLLILQEDYPELKSDSNFMDLQYNLKEIENNISDARQSYNRAVFNYKNKLEMFPSNVIASIFHFQPELFFTIEEEDKENPNISFQ